MVAYLKARKQGVSGSLPNYAIFEKFLWPIIEEDTAIDFENLPEDKLLKDACQKVCNPLISLPLSALPPFKLLQQRYLESTHCQLQANKVAGESVAVLFRIGFEVSR